MGCVCSVLSCCVAQETSNSLLLEEGGNQQNHQQHTEGQVNLSLDFSELRAVHYLANGGMCSIYTAEFKGQPVVVKIPRDDCAQPEVARKDLETEIDILTRLGHPNVVRVVGAGHVCPLDVDADGREAADFRDLNQPPKRFVLLEHLAGGTLTEQMGLGQPPAEGVVGSVVRRWQQNWLFPTKKALDSAMQLASALSYLHHDAVEGSFVVHRDLKPENIAFTADGRLKLFDFGLAKIVQRRRGRLSQRYEMTGETGSTRYMCPEVALQCPYNEKADVYSFGLILWEMLSLKRPFEGLNRKEFVHTVIKGGRRPALRQEWSEDLKSLLRRCWSEDIDMRPGFKEVEQALVEVLQREAAWGLLSPSHGPSMPGQQGVGSINGRPGGGDSSGGGSGGAKPGGLNAGVGAGGGGRGSGGGGSAAEGSANGLGDASPNGTRTFV